MFTTHQHSRIALTVLTLLATCLCFGGPKTDTVTLINGNVIKCEVKKLSRGVLTASTDSLSTVSIRWEDVVQINSPATFELAFSDGSTVLSTLASASNGTVRLVSGTEVPLITVVTMTPIRTSFWKKFNGTADAGYSYYKSDNTTQLNFNGQLNYTRPRRTTGIQVNSNLLLRDESNKTKRMQSELVHLELISTSYFILGLGQLSSNDELNLLKRYLAGGGVGRYFVHTNRTILAAYGGVAYSTERYTSGDQQNNGEGIVGVNAQVFRLYSPKLDITGDFKYWPNFTTSGRYRLDTQITTRVEIYRDLFVSFSIFDNFDQKNPTTLAPLNDYGVVMSLGYSFNR